MDVFEQKSFERQVLRIVACELGGAKRASFLKGVLYVSADGETAAKVAATLRNTTTSCVTFQPATDPPGKIYVFRFS